MVENIQGAMSSIEQYRTIMNIIKMWDAYRMPVLYAFGILLVLTITLFIMKSCWKKWFLTFTILTGLVIVGLDGFKMYVEYKKKEAIQSAFMKPVEEIANVVEGSLSEGTESVKDTVKGLLK